MLSSQHAELIHIALTTTGRREFDGVLDSGATTSLISPDLARALHAKEKKVPAIRLRFANNKTQITDTIASLPITFRNKTRSFTFRITPNLPFPCLCGIDFLKDFHVIIRSTPNAVTVGTDDSEWTLMADLPNDPYSPIKVSTVSCKNDVILPPHTAMQVTVRSSEISHGLALVEPHMVNSVRLNIGMNAGMCYFSNGTAEVIIRNPNPHPVQLYRGTNLGFIDHGAPDETSSDVLVADSLKSDLIPAEEIDINPKLPDSLKRELKRIVTKHSDLFAWKITQLPRTHLLQHRIELLPNVTPPFQRPYRTSRAEEDILDSIIEEMLNADILERSCSPYSSPYLLVKKKNGTWRLVHNFILLNKVTKKDRFPLPRIDDLLDNLLKKKYFSTFDLFSGFYQLELHPDDREKTSFLTRKGSFQFKRMPMGICNAPSSFQRLMNMALDDLIGPSCLCYMDDVCVFGSTFTEHMDNLEKVFKAVRKANLRFQLSKC